MIPFKSINPTKISEKKGVLSQWPPILKQKVSKKMWQPTPPQAFAHCNDDVTCRANRHRPRASLGWEASSKGDGLHGERGVG